MTNDALRILITGQLDAKQTETHIRNQLSEIGKKLKIDIGVNDKQLSQITNEVKKIKDQLNTGQKSDLISAKDVQSIDQILTKYKQLGSVKMDRTINPITQDVEKLNLTITKANGEVQKLKFELASLKGIQGLSGQYLLTGSKSSDNSAAIREKQLQTEQAINRNIDTQNAKLKHQLEMYKQEAALKAKSLINGNSSNKNFDTTGINNWLASVNRLNTTTPNVNQQMDRLNLGFRDINAQARISSAQVSEFGRTLENAFVRMPVYMAASALIFAPIIAVKQLIDTLYVLDERLVSINKVMDGANMAEVWNTASDAAFKYGQTIDAALASFESIAKLGFSQSDTEALNNNSMLLSTVGEFKNSGEAAEYLTAIMKQYKLEVSDTISVVDSLNNLSNKSGASTDSLAQGLSKSSSAAAMAKVTFHELSGMIATTQESLHITGNEAGTFFKALFSRFLRPKTQEMIEGLGISTKNASGELRSATDVIADLGEKWDTFDEMTQNGIASQLGGGWHVNKVTNLLQQQDRVLRNTNVSMDSYGSATKELETFQGGLQFKTNEMISSFQALAMAIGEAGARGAIVTFLETVTSMTKGFTELTEKTDGWNIKLPLIAAGVYGTIKAIGALRVALTGLKISFGVIGLAVIAVELLASAFLGASSASDVNTEALTETAQKTSDQTSELQKLVAAYDELKPQAEGNAEKQAQLQGILQQIQAIAPQLVESTGKYGDALTLNKDKTDQYIESLKTMTQEQIAQAQIGNNIEINAVNVDIDEAKSELKELESSYKNSMDTIQGYQIKFNVKGLEDAEKEFNTRIKSIANEVGKAAKAGDSGLADSLTAGIEKASREYEDYIRLMKDANGGLGSYAEQLTTLQELEGKKQGIEQRKKALDDLNDTTAAGEIANKDSGAALNEVNGEASSTLTAVRDLTDGTEGLTEATEGSTAATKDKMSTSEQLLGVTSAEIDSVYEALAVYQMLSDQENLSAQYKDMLTNATATLTNMYPGLTNAKGLDIQMIQEEVRQQEILLNALEMAAKGQLTSQEMQTVNTALGTQSRIEMFNAELQALQKMAEAYQEAALRTYESAVQFDDQTNILAAERLYKRYLDTNESIAKNKTDLQSLVPDFKNSINSIAKFTDYQDRNVKSTDKSAKANKDAAKGNKKAADSAKDAAKEYEAWTYVADKFKQKMEEINLVIAKQQSLQNKYPTYSKKYQKALKEEIKQLEKKKKLIDGEVASLNKQIKAGKPYKTGPITKEEAAQNPDISPVSNSDRGKSKSKVSAANYIKRNTKSQSGITAAEINAVIKKSAPKNSLFQGKGATFIKAGEASGLDPLYLLAHAAHETGWGTSNIAKKKGNMFGIGAFDSSAYKSAYKYNGTDAGIVEGSKWIAKNYTNKGQDSLHKMRFNNGKHQYATDPKWADKIAKIMADAANKSGAKGGTSAKAKAASVKETKASAASVVKVTAKGTEQSLIDYYNKFRVTTKFGVTDKTHPKGTHPSGHGGVDLSNGRGGDPVKALKGGKVITAAYSKSAGNWVVVQQDDGTVAKYMHMQKGLKVKAGQKIKAGTELGKVGNTGRSYGNHLHLQVEKNGKKIDPLSYYGLKGKGKGSSGSGDNSIENFVNLKRGSKGKDVKAIQKLLEIKVDGIFGESTEKAVKKFQKKNKLKQTGIVDLKTYKKLDPEGATERSKKSAENQEALDGAESEKNNLKEESIAVSEEIQQLYKDLVDANISVFEHAIEGIDNKIQSKELDAQYLDPNSQKYRKNLTEQIDLHKQKKKELADEVAYIEEEIKSNKNLSELAREELKNNLAGKKNALKEISLTVEEINRNIAKSSLDELLNNYEKKVTALEDRLAAAEGKQKKYRIDPDDMTLQKKIDIDNKNKEIDAAVKLGDLKKEKKLRKELAAITNGYWAAEKERVKVIYDEIKATKSNRNALEAKLKLDKLDAETKAEVEAAIRAADQALQGYSDSLQESADAMEDFIADEMTKQKEIALEHLREQFEAINKELDELVAKDDVFNSGEFSDSIDDLLYQLDVLNGNFSSSAVGVSSTDLVRQSVEKTKKEIMALNAEIDSMIATTAEGDKELEALIRNQISRANELSKTISEYANKIRDTQFQHKQTEAALQHQIDLKRDQLDLLDDEYEKEDRLKSLRDIEDEMNKVRNDKRFSYIDASGNETLTYDKGKLDDLSEQRDDLLKQYQREEIKNAMNDEISAMEKSLARTQEIHAQEVAQMELHRQALETLHGKLIDDISEKRDKLNTIQDKMITDTEKQWEDLIKAVRNGTMSYDDLMKTWYAGAIEEMKKYNSEVNAQVANMKSAYESLKYYRDAAAKLDAEESKDSSGKKTRYTLTKGNVTKLAYSDAEADALIKDGYGIIKVEKYHEGGIAGFTNGAPSKLATLWNDAFNVKPGEVMTKQLVGELNIPPKNIPNIGKTMQSLVNSALSSTPSVIATGDTISLNNVQIVANNPNELFQGIQRLVRMNKN